jgi:hypothetical protein
LGEIEKQAYKWILLLSPLKVMVEKCPGKLYYLKPGAVFSRTYPLVDFALFFTLSYPAGKPQPPPPRNFANGFEVREKEEEF